jgi:polysaccharide biosynthesis protein PelA
VSGRSEASGRAGEMPSSKGRTHVRRQVLRFLGGLGIGAMSASPARALKLPMRSDYAWAVFYGEDIDLEAFAGFDLVVLDPMFKGAVGQLAERGTQVLGYLSFGEIRRSSEWFAHITDRTLLLSENANWPDTFVCDVRNPQWRTLLLEVAIPALRQRGFTGLFLDTLDTPPHLEKVDPAGCAGMRRAAIALIGEIRKTFPSLSLVANRGYALLPELEGEIDALVAESLLTTYDFAAKRYKWVAPDELGYHMQALRPLREGGSSVPILSLDYWDSDDPATIRDIYARERGLGHHPYVAQILLDRVTPAPRP